MAATLQRTPQLRNRPPDLDVPGVGGLVFQCEIARTDLERKRDKIDLEIVVFSIGRLSVNDSLWDSSICAKVSQQVMHHLT
jgi:hypothetical protein